MQDGIDSGVSSPAPSAHGEPVASTTLKPSADSSFVSTTQKTLLEDNDKFNELDLLDLGKKSSPKSNKPLTDRTKTAKFQGDAITAPSPPAPVFTATEVPASPEDTPKAELPQSPVEDGPVSGYNGPLSYGPVSTTAEQVQGHLTDSSTNPLPPSGDFGGQPGYLSPPGEAPFPLVGTDAEGISAPIGESGPQYAGPSDGLPAAYDTFPGTLPPEIGASTGPAFEEGLGSLHREEENAVPSNAGESVSHSDTRLQTEGGVNPPPADTQVASKVSVSSDEPEKPLYYSGPSSFGYGRLEVPETTTVPTLAEAPVHPAAPVDTDSEKQSESIDSTLTTPQLETLGVPNTVHDPLLEEKSSTEREATTTSSLGPMPSGESDSKTGRSLDLEGDSATASTTTASVSEEKASTIPVTTSSPNDFEVTTSSAPQVTGVQGAAEGPEKSIYAPEAAETSTPKTEGTTQHVDITTAEHDAERTDEDNSLTMFPERYRPTSKNGVTTAAPSETSSSVESSTSVPGDTTLGGVAVGTTEHPEATAAATTEGVSGSDVHGTASPASPLGTSTVYVPEVATDLSSSSTMTPLTTTPQAPTQLTDVPVSVVDTTTDHISTEPTTLLPVTSASPDVEPSTRAEEPTTKESTTTKPTTAEPTTANSFAAVSTNADFAAAEPTTAWTTTVQPIAPDQPTTQPTTAAPTTLVPTTTEALRETPTTSESTSTEKTLVDLVTAEGSTAAPITQAPTTAVPTTAASTTTVSTTEVPTTEVPTTEVPATAVPTTAVPTTEVPSTEVPSTEVPSTEVPSTEVPSAEVPSTEVPSTEVPSTEVPLTEVPSTEVPSTEVPSTEAPSTEVPTTGVPTTAVPTTAAPTTAAPTTAAPTTAALTTAEPTTAETTTTETTTVPPVMSVSTFSSASTSTPEPPPTPETVSAMTETSTTPEDTSVTTSDAFFRPGPSAEEEQPTTRADTTPEPSAGETTTGAVSNPWMTVVHSASRSPKQLTHPSTSSTDQTTPSVTPAATTDVVSDAAFTTVTPLDAFTSSESGEQETTTRVDLFTTLFPEVTTMMRAVTTTEAVTSTAHVVVVSDNTVDTETVATVTTDVTCNIQSRNLTVACLLPQELNNTVTVKFSEWDHRRTEAFRLEAKRRLADYCLRKGIPLGDTTVVFVANEHGMDLISFFVINQTRGSVVPAATLISFLNETKPTLEDAVSTLNRQIN
ncbi:unnamed protein product [Ixodes hexagonus]